VLIALRKQLAESEGRITAPSLAQLLLENGHLTAFQAEEMLRDRREANGENEARFGGPGPVRIAELESPPPSPLFPPTPPSPPAPLSPPAAATPPAAGESVPSPSTTTGSAPIPAESLPAAVGAESIEDLLSDASLGGDDQDTVFQRDLGHGRSMWRPFRRQPAVRKIPKRQRRSEWDSPLLLVGGGALVLLVLLGGTVYYLIERGGGDKLREAADAAYQSGAYAQAIDKYDQFLERFPHHTSASQGRVRRGLAKLRLVLQTSHDGPKRLAAAQEILAGIEEEVAFPEARAELAALLPQIAEVLAQQAQSSDDPQATRTYIGLTTDALGLVTNSNYVPRSLFPKNRVANIRAVLDGVERKLHRDQALHETVAHIEQAVAAGDSDKAYAVRSALLSIYPALASVPALQQAVQTIVRAEQARVHRVDRVQSATKDDPLPISVAVAVPRKAGRRGPLTGEPVLARLDGAVYAIDAESGSLLWRRPVGFDPQVLPTVLGASGDVLLVNSNEGALERVDRATGAMRWRLVLGKRLTTPRVREGTIWVSARSGQIFSIDSRTGKSTHFLDLPQSLTIPPALHPRKPVLYQLADHSTLFVLSRDQMACEEVFYLGHRSGSVDVPPVVVLNRYLVVAENRGRETGILHLLAIDENGRKLHEVQQARLEGHIVTPLAVAGRLLVAATDRGQIRLFELGAPSEKDPLVEIAQRSTVDKRPLVRHVLIEGSHLWLAGNALTKYRVHTQTGQLVPAGIQVSYPGQMFTSPLQLVGKRLIQIRRHDDRDGYLVTAIGVGDGQTLWETELAQPPAGEPVVSAKSNRVALILSGGALFEMDAASLKERKADNEPLSGEVLPDTSPRLGHRVDMRDGRALFVPERGHGRVLLYDPAPNIAEQRVHWFSAPPAAVCLPAAHGAGLLWPTTDGQVLYLRPSSGKALAEPFQPALRPGSLPHWMTPSPVPHGKGEFVVADASGMFFRVGMAAEPTRHLRTLAQTPDVDRPLARGPVISGERVYAITADRHLITYQLPNLTAGPSVDLQSTIQWGPYPVGAGILLTTDTTELVRVDEAGKVAWRVPLPAGPLIGRPLVDQKQVTLASVDGTVIRVALETGSTSGQRRLGQPAATGPVRWGSDILVAGHDGTLLIAPAP